MQIQATYSHLNGHEWLEVRRPNYWTEIQNIVQSIDAEKFRIKVSKEKGMIGKLLYDPTSLNAEFKRQLLGQGWLPSTVRYWVTDDQKLIRQTIDEPAPEQKRMIEESGRVPILSYNQTDFVKDRVAIEVQFGKYSFIAYDVFVKHLAFYVGDQIDCGIEILPMKCMQREMSSGPGYYEGALYDIVRQGRGVPAVPLVLVGIAP